MTVLILSNTANLKYYMMLKKCVRGIPKKFNVLIVETNSKLQERPRKIDDRSTFIFPNTQFHYNKFVNYGLEYIKSVDDDDRVIISNNDLIFKSGAVNTIAEALLEYDSVCPWDTADKMQSDYIQGNNDLVGTTLGIHVIGYCIGTKFSTLEKTGGFDERFSFWYQDNDYADLLKKHNIRHALIPQAEIVHLGMASHRLLKNPEELTREQEKIYLKKRDDS